jgi:hypothetical protein
MGSPRRLILFAAVIAIGVGLRAPQPRPQLLNDERLLGT